MESTNKEPASSPTSPGERRTSRSTKRNKERDSSKAKEKARRARDHPATTPGAVPSSSRSSKRSKGRNSSKAKEKARRAGDHPVTTPGAVPSSSSNRLERQKESSTGGKRRSSSSVNKPPGGRKSRYSSSASKPGAVHSTGKGDSRSSSSSKSHRPSSSKASSGSSTTRRSRLNEEKQRYLAGNTPGRGPSSVAASASEMESGLVAEAVEDTEVQTTANALRDKNRENEALRKELQRRDEEEQASQSSRRHKIPLWGKVLGALILIGAVVGAVIAFSGGGSGDEAATPVAILVPSDSTTSEPTDQAITAVPTGSPTDSATANPDDQAVFDPPSTSACSKIADGRPVDGQEDMTKEEALPIRMNVYLTVDITDDQWLPGFLENIQQLVMPPVVGCGNTTLEVFTIGNAQVDESNVGMVVPCEDQTNGPCHTVELQVNLFMKKEVVNYDINDLNQHIEEVFKTSRSLLVNAQDENSKAIRDIGSVTSTPVVPPSPSHQPSSNRIVTSNSPSTSPSFQPTMTSTSGATASPTPGPTVTPASGPTLAPSSAPSLGPSQSPTTAPSQAPAPGSTPPPSPLPTPGPTTPPTPPPTPGPTTPPTPLPTLGPSALPSSLPTYSLVPSPGPSIAPTSGPTDSPSRAPSPIPSWQPSAAPTSKCSRLEATLSQFAPFDGNKGQALNWLCSSDTWEPPVDAADETTLWVERFVLAVFYYATTAGDEWRSGWMTSASVCSWTGFDGSSGRDQCNGDGSVIGIVIADPYDHISYDTVGDFPDELRALSNLEEFSFADHLNMSGSFPSFITALTKLTSLYIAGTGRTGSIPSELADLTKLIRLGLLDNFLTGTIPPGIAAMTDLTQFLLSNNNLTGSLPVGFDSMTQLEILFVNENSLGGTIPPLPSSLTPSCYLASENSWSLRTEANCFTGTTNAPGICDVSANCP